MDTISDDFSSYLLQEGLKEVTNVVGGGSPLFVIL
jgi:hypothetical protein